MILFQNKYVNLWGKEDEMQGIGWVDQYCDEEVRERRRYVNDEVPEGAVCLNCSRKAMFFWYQFYFCENCFQQLLENVSMKKEESFISPPKHRKHRSVFWAFTNQLFSLF